MFRGGILEHLHSEEDVKFKHLVPYLEQRGYKQACMDFNVAVEVHEGRKKKTIFADAVVYASIAKKAPLIVCETKAPIEVLDRSAREQAISYARLLPKIAPLTLLTNGAQVQIFHTLNKARVGELPSRTELDDDIVKFVLDRDVQEALKLEAKHDLFIIDDVRTFKSILKSCHNEIRNNEGLDPTAAFDEMSKVMFCKLYEEKENPKENRFRLAVFDDTQARLKINIVRKIFEEAKGDPAYAGLFLKDAQITLKDRTIRKIVELFESYDLGLTAFDVKGEAFEYFLGDTFTGGLGEYFTPRNIVEFMVEAIDPKIGDKIIDPFCGTGGFMIYAFEVVSEKIRLQEFSDEEKQKWRYELSNNSLFGTDWKERTSQSCKMNMMVHGDGSSGVFMHDGFQDVPGVIIEEKFNICLTNPPFGSMETDPSTLGRYELGAGRKSQDRVILAMERAIRLVKPGGKIGIVVIDGVLNTKKRRYVRDYVRRNAWVRGIVSLNKETFEGYGARAKTSILFLEKKLEPNDQQQSPAFVAIARNTGLAANGDAVPGNVLPDVLLDYRDFLKGKMKVGTSGKHSEAICVELTDRLDAEYYARKVAATKVDLPALTLEVGAVQKALTQRFEGLRKTHSALTSARSEPTKLRDLFDQVEEKEKIVPDQIYRLLGVRWWGEGAFLREEKLGRNIKATSIFKVSAKCLIYNRLFAYRGSFAVVPAELDGCYVSNEFPTFSLKESIPDGELVTRFVVHCLNSPQYLAVVDAESTGSTPTSRNRFNEEEFLDLAVRLPATSKLLLDAVTTLDSIADLRREQEKLLDLTKLYREESLRLLPEPPEL